MSDKKTKPKTAAAKLADSQERRGPVYVGISDEVPVIIIMSKADKEAIKRVQRLLFEALPADRPDNNTLIAVVDKVIRCFERSYR